MSHFAVTVLLPPEEAISRDAAEKAIEGRLLPYSEHLAVAPYESTCSCCDDPGEVPDPACEDCAGTGRYITTVNPESKWDWWQIGGRFTGFWVADYDPEKDPRNQEPCYNCNGPNARYEQASCLTCNGEGILPKWPTQWRPFENDILPVSEIISKAITYALVTPDGKWFEREPDIYDDELYDAAYETWEAEYRRLLAGYGDFIAVIVDCHI
ncbi:MAG: hypothetical protein SFU56_15495 [Capsulimonadales bacterium]|nr:hypothetical protein [Capsulimonadales bacterium]